MNKIERISAILIKLQSRKSVTAQHIADQFGISLRTVYRDIRVLEEAGIPVVSNMGVGYSLAEGYRLPPLMFTAEEAIAFLMAEKVLSMQSGADTYKLYRNGMDKIRTVLQASGKEILEDFDSHIQVVDMLSPPVPEPLYILQPLLDCIIRAKAMEIRYTDAFMKTSVRTVEPVGIFYMFHNWYVLTWCRAKKDYRTFHLGRMEYVKPLDEGFTRPHQSLKAILKLMFPNEAKNPYQVKIKTSKAAVRDMGAGKYLYGLSAEQVVDDDSVVQEYTVTSLEYFARWYLSFADRAEIMEPVELKNVVKELIRNIKI